MWLILNFVFFCTIDLSYLKTFFSRKTGPQYTCDLYAQTNEDSMKFDAVFSNRIQYSSKIHDDMKEWVAVNIEDWFARGASWFQVELIPDEFLPTEVFVAVGGASRRRRSSTNIREVVNNILNDEPVSETMLVSATIRKNGAWRELAEALYEQRSNNHKSNFTHGE